MAEWLRKIQKSFSKKSDKTEAPEDFILLRPLSDESAENHQASPEIDGGANSASSSQINDNVSSPSFEELYKQVYHEDFPDDLGELSDSETARQTAEADLSNTSELDVTQIDAGLDEPEAEVLAPYAPKHEDDQADLTETTFLPLDELESKL